MSSVKKAFFLQILDFYKCPINFLAFCYNMTVNLRGMNFLVFPYNAVLNAGVFDDAVVADGDIGADGAVLDDYVLADDAGLNYGGCGVVARAGFCPVLE